MVLVCACAVQDYVAQFAVLAVVQPLGDASEACAAANTNVTRQSASKRSRPVFMVYGYLREKVVYFILTERLLAESRCASMAVSSFGAPSSAAKSANITTSPVFRVQNCEIRAMVSVAPREFMENPF